MESIQTKIEETPHLREPSQSNRKHWLFATLFLFIVYPIILFAVSALSLGKEMFSKEMAYQTSFFMLGRFISFWVIWHCAYKKYGTSLLTWFLVITPINFLITVYQIFNRDWNNLDMVLLALDFVVNVWWYISSLQLRKINQKVQIETFLASDAYLKAVSSMRSALNSKELDARFYDAIREAPYYFKKVLSPLYEEIKQRLSVSASHH